jgi:serine/threonine protein kinase
MLTVFYHVPLPSPLIQAPVYCSGQFGDVWKSTWSGVTLTGEIIPLQTVAAKILKVSGASEVDKHFHRELSNLSKLRHRNIIDLLGASTLDEVILVTSYANAGSLYSFLHQDSIVSLQRLTRLIILI